MDDMFDFECNHCGCGYDRGDGKFSPQLEVWVCEPCFDELNEQNR
jgi:hypothetical protein